MDTTSSDEKIYLFRIGLVANDEERTLESHVRCLPQHAMEAIHKWASNRRDALTIESERYHIGYMEIRNFHPGTPQPNGYISEVSPETLYQWKIDRGELVNRFLTPAPRPPMGGFCDYLTSPGEQVCPNPVLLGERFCQYHLDQVCDCDPRRVMDYPCPVCRVPHTSFPCSHGVRSHDPGCYARPLPTVP